MISKGYDHIKMISYQSDIVKVILELWYMSKWYSNIKKIWYQRDMLYQSDIISKGYRYIKMISSCLISKGYNHIKMIWYQNDILYQKDIISKRYIISKWYRAGSALRPNLRDTYPLSDTLTELLILRYPLPYFFRATYLW